MKDESHDGCQQKGCDGIALFEIFWPGKTTRQCAEHTKKVLALGRNMGIQVDTRLLPEADS